MKKTLVILSLLVFMSFSIFGAVVSSEDEAGIYLMSEEEKLARDVYLELYDIWGLKTFANIAKSEQVHMDEVAELVESFGLENPALSEFGMFVNEELQDLYDNLIAQGSVSLEEAIKVGIAIEELDIKDLQELIAQTTDEEIIEVYSNLLSGSYNHLESFTKQLSRYENDITGNEERGQAYSSNNPGRNYANSVNNSSDTKTNGNGNYGEPKLESEQRNNDKEDCEDCTTEENNYQNQRNYSDNQASSSQGFGNRYSTNNTDSNISGKYTNYSSNQMTGNRFSSYPQQSNKSAQFQSFNNSGNGNYMNSSKQGYYSQSDCQMTENFSPKFQQNSVSGYGNQPNSNQMTGNRFSSYPQQGSKSGQFQNFNNIGNGNYMSSSKQGSFSQNNCQMKGDFSPRFQQNSVNGYGNKSYSNQMTGNKFSSYSQQGNFAGKVQSFSNSRFSESNRNGSYMNNSSYDRFNHTNDCSGENFESGRFFNGK